MQAEKTRKTAKKREKVSMSPGDVDLNRRPAAAIIWNSTRFFPHLIETHQAQKKNKETIDIIIVNDMSVAHFINPSEFFTQSLKTSPIGPF